MAGTEDITLDAESPLAIAQRPNWEEDSSPIEMELIEGDSGVSQESGSLVQTRLQSAGLALGFGFTLFSLWTWIREVSSTMDHLGVLFLAFQTCTAITLMGIGWWLSRVRQPSKSCLTWCELLIFGLPTLFFGTFHYAEILFVSRNFDLITQMPMAGWIILIFAYAVFVPNDWRRVLVVVSVISSVPLLATAIAMVIHPDVKKMITFDPSSSVEMLLALAATIFAAVTSVRMISQLRSKAEEAKELGRYRLKKKIGSGGMGDVYLAEHRLMKRPCAIKVIRPEKAGDPKAIARFEREVRATARLNHWNSVSIFDYGRTSDGKFFYVMEYLTGLSLQEMVKHKGPLSPGRTVYLLRQVCNALIEAHSIQLVHRDIKPANLIVTELGGAYDVIKLLDFGLAKPIVPEMGSEDDSALTIAGSLTGSPLYMSPEQAMGDVNADHRTDLYALGGVAFYLLTGRSPFESGPTLKVLLAHLNEPAIAPSVARAQQQSAKTSSGQYQPLGTISPELDRLVLKCLAKSPDERFSTARELLDALNRLPEATQWNERLAEQWWTSNCCHYQAEHG